jgi:hypothetical protein
MGISEIEADRMLSEKKIFSFDVNSWFTSQQKYDIGGLSEKDAPTSEQVTAAGIQLFHHGLVIGYQLRPDGSEQRDLVLAMRFNNFIDLDPDTQHNVRKLGKYFHQVAKALPQVQSNTPWIKSGKRKSCHYSLFVILKVTIQTEECMLWVGGQPTKVTMPLVRYIIIYRLGLSSVGIYTKARNASVEAYHKVYIESQYVAVSGHVLHQEIGMMTLDKAL